MNFWSQKVRVWVCCEILGKNLLFSGQEELHWPPFMVSPLTATAVGTGRKKMKLDLNFSRFCTDCLFRVWSKSEQKFIEPQALYSCFPSSSSSPNYCSPVSMNSESATELRTDFFFFILLIKYPVTLKIRCQVIVFNGVSDM